MRSKLCLKAGDREECSDKLGPGEPTSHTSYLKIIYMGVMQRHREQVLLLVNFPVGRQALQIAPRGHSFLAITVVLQ
jgi:hypothetical protein